MNAVEENPREGAPEHFDTTEARRAHRLAVKSSLERDEARSLRGPVLSRVLHRQLDGHLDRGRPIVAEEHAREPGRRHLT